MNDSEEWRRECEARQVLKFNKARRNEYYRGVLANRGLKARDELISEVNRQYRLMSNQAEI